MISKQDVVRVFHKMTTHAVLHLLAVLIFLGSLLLVPAPWRDFGFVVAGLLGVGAGITQTFWEYRHDAITPVGKAIEWIVLGYLAIGGWGIAELYLAWAAVYVLP